MKGSRKITTDLSLERLSELLDYNPATGVFVWKVARCNVKVGDVAGRTYKPTNYRVIRIDDVDYYAARLAWYYVTGEWPRGAIRYQDKNRENLAFDNLGVGRWVATKHDHRTKEGRAAYGKAHRKAHPGFWRGHYLQRDFGISLADYAAMAAAQDNVCAICEKAETMVLHGKVKALSVDHCHETGALRGLLCSDCNTAIGLFADDRGRLIAALRYLDKHSGAAKPAVLLKEAK